MRLFFSPAARQDLLDIGDYIAQDNPVRALSFVDELEEAWQRARGRSASVSAH